MQVSVSNQSGEVRLATWFVDLYRLYVAADTTTCWIKTEGHLYDALWKYYFKGSFLKGTVKSLFEGEE